MKPRVRIRTLFKWLGFVATAATICAGVLSTWRYAYLAYQGNTIGLSCGTLECHIFTGDKKPRVPFRLASSTTDPDFENLLIRLTAQAFTGRYTTKIPLDELLGYRWIGYS